MAVGCIICTEEFSAWQTNDKTSVVIKSCGHVFHDTCLKLWLKTSRTCPVCRQTTFDTPNYIGRVHLQRLSLDNTSINNLLDEAIQHKNKVEELEKTLKNKEAELKKKNSQIKELQEKNNGIVENFNKCYEVMKNIKTSLNNPIVEIKDDDEDEVAPVVINRETIQPRPTISRTARAILTSSASVPVRPQRPLLTTARSITRVTARPRVTLGSNLNPVKHN